MFNFKNRWQQRGKPLAENPPLVELRLAELGWVNGGGGSIQIGAAFDATLVDGGLPPRPPKLIATLTLPEPMLTGPGLPRPPRPK